MIKWNALRRDTKTQGAKAYLRQAEILYNAGCYDDAISCITSAMNYKTELQRFRAKAALAIIEIIQEKQQQT